MNESLVSVIIPYYKGEKYIGQTLDSLFAENYANLEVIVVNDGSPVETLSVFDSYRDRITLIDQENAGQAAARNTGFRQAKGSIIAFIDQDDLWPKGRLQTMLSHLLADESADFVRGQTQFFWQATNTLDEPAFRFALIGSALYRKRVFDIVGLFEPSMRIGEDFEWNVRLSESGVKEIRIPDVTLIYRKHDNNQSDATNFIQDGQFESIRRKLARAREQKADNT